MESIWQKSIEIKSFPKLKSDIKTDVLIIGGGIAGILTAYFLKESGTDCILLEKHKLCSGTTGHTTGKITAQHGLVYHKLLKNEGLEIVQKYLNGNLLALDKFSELCKNIDCDYVSRDSYVYSMNDINNLELELSALMRLGYSAVFCDKTSLPFKIKGALMFENQSQFNPLKFLSEISKELHIYENTFVKEICGNTAITNNGDVTANAIIITTHFPFINKHGSYFLKLYQHRSYVLALENAEDLNGMYVDESKTGFSFRNYDKYLLIGGGGHRTGKRGGNWSELREFSKKYYPNAKEYCFWAAQDCMSLDQMPYIGRYSNRTARLFTASGFNKWGMTGAMLSAYQIQFR